MHPFRQPRRALAAVLCLLVSGHALAAPMFRHQIFGSPSVTPSSGSSGDGSTGTDPSAPAHQPLVWNPFLSNFSANVGRAYNKTMGGRATSPNGGTISFSGTGLPPGITVASSPITGGVTALFSGTATTTGTYPGSVTATDGFVSKTVSVTFTVLATPPTWWDGSGTEPVLAVTTGVPVSFTLPPATDNNGLPVIYGASGLPDGLSLDPSTGVISGTVTTQYTFPAEQNEIFGNLGVTARDAISGTTSNLVELEILPSATPNFLSGGADVPFGQPISRSYPVASDVGGFALTQSISGFPSGLTWNATTGTLSGTTSDACGQYNGTLTTSDAYSIVTAPIVVTVSGCP